MAIVIDVELKTTRRSLTINFLISVVIHTVGTKEVVLRGGLMEGKVIEKVTRLTLEIINS